MEINLLIATFLTVWAGDGDNISPHLVDRRADGHQKFCRDLLRSRRADRFGWWHWVVVNLPADTRSTQVRLSPVAAPDGVIQTRTIR